LLALPVLVVLIATLYWFVRVRFTAWSQREPIKAQRAPPLAADAL